MLPTLQHSEQWKCGLSICYLVIYQNIYHASPILEQQNILHTSPHSPTHSRISWRHSMWNGVLSTRIFSCIVVRNLCMGFGDCYSMMSSSMHTSMGWLCAARMGLNDMCICEYSHIQRITQRSDFALLFMFTSLTRLGCIRVILATIWDKGLCCHRRPWVLTGPTGRTR